MIPLKDSDESKISAACLCIKPIGERNKQKAKLTFQRVVCSAALLSCDNLPLDTFQAVLVSSVSMESGKLGSKRKNGAG